MSDLPPGVIPLWMVLHGHPRSPRWRAKRLEHLKREPFCRWCGGTKFLNVHHVKPFHLFPELELDGENLITLCEAPGFACHFKHGHNGTSWSDWNPHIKRDAKASGPNSDTPTKA